MQYNNKQLKSFNVKEGKLETKKNYIIICDKSIKLVEMVFLDFYIINIQILLSVSKIAIIFYLLFILLSFSALIIRTDEELNKSLIRLIMNVHNQLDKETELTMSKYLVFRHLLIGFIIESECTSRGQHFFNFQGEIIKGLKELNCKYISKVFFYESITIYNC